MIGRAPAELLGDLEAEGARALGVVGPHVDVDEGPRLGLRHLRAEPVHVVVGALDHHERRVVDAAADDLALLEVVRDEDDRLHPGAGAVRGDGVREVAGAGAGDAGVAELARLRDRDGDDAVLERPRRVDGVVLDPEPLEAERRRQVVGAQQRREARPEVHAVLRLGRQQVGVAPQRGRPGGDGLAGDRGGDALVVIGDLEGAETELAEEGRGERELAPALAAAE